MIKAADLLAKHLHEKSISDGGSTALAERESSTALESADTARSKLPPATPFDKHFETRAEAADFILSRIGMIEHRRTEGGSIVARPDEGITPANVRDLVRDLTLAFKDGVREAFFTADTTPAEMRELYERHIGHTLRNLLRAQEKIIEGE